MWKFISILGDLFIVWNVQWTMLLFYESSTLRRCYILVWDPVLCRNIAHHICLDGYHVFSKCGQMKVLQWLAVHPIVIAKFWYSSANVNTFHNGCPFRWRDTKRIVSTASTAWSSIHECGTNISFYFYLVSQRELCQIVQESVMPAFSKLVKYLLWLSLNVVWSDILQEKFYLLLRIQRLSQIFKFLHSIIHSCETFLKRNCCFQFPKEVFQFQACRCSATHAMDFSNVMFI